MFSFMDGPDNSAWMVEFKILLQQQLEKSKRRNKRFSLRSFSKKIGLAASTLSQLLNDKTTFRFREERALKILEILDVSEREKNAIYIKMNRPVIVRPFEFPKEDLQLISDDLAIPLLHYIDVSAEDFDVASAAKYFGVDEVQIKKNLELLKSRDLVVALADKRIVRKEFFISHPALPQQAHLDFARNNLLRAGKSLEAFPLEDQLHAAFTFAGTKETLGVLEKELKSLFRRLSANTPLRSREVYRLSISAVPMRSAEFSDK